MGENAVAAQAFDKAAPIASADNVKAVQEMLDAGKRVLLSAPVRSGKTTLAKALRQALVITCDMSAYADTPHSYATPDFVTKPGIAPLLVANYIIVDNIDYFPGDIPSVMAVVHGKPALFLTREQFLSVDQCSQSIYADIDVVISIKVEDNPELYYYV